VVARLQERDAGAEDGRHARGGGDAAFAPFGLGVLALVGTVLPAAHRQGVEMQFVVHGLSLRRAQKNPLCVTLKQVSPPL